MKVSILLARSLTEIACFIVVMTIVGCGLIPNPVIPVAPTSVPTKPQGLMQGHWEGNSPSVSCDVTADGEIRNFQLVGSLPLGRCTITIDAIAVRQTGKFELGQADNSPMHITGELTSPKAFEGAYKIRSCRGAGDQVSVVMNPEDKPWKAKWKGNVSPPTSVSSVQSATAPLETPRIVTQSWTATPTNTPRPTATVIPFRVPTKPTSSPSPTAQLQALLPSGTWQRISTLPRQINAFADDPSNPQVVYAARRGNTSGSGVYKSEDRGKTWRSASDGLPAEDIAALAFAHAAPFTLYALSGVRGDIYASSDKPGNWARLGNTGVVGGFWRRLVTSPDNKNILFALSPGDGMARSADGGQAWTPIRRGIPADQYSVFVQSLVIERVTGM